MTQTRSMLRKGNFGFSELGWKMKDMPPLPEMLGSLFILEKSLMSLC